jgi:hypothetical protein
MARQGEAGRRVHGCEAMEVVMAVEGTGRVAIAGLGLGQGH